MSLDSEIIMKNGEPIGTQTPTGHYVLLDTRFEPPPGIAHDTAADFVCRCNVGAKSLYSLTL